MGKIASDIKSAEVEATSILTEEQRSMQIQVKETVGPARGIGPKISKHVSIKRLKSMFRKQRRGVTFRKYAHSLAKSGDPDAQQWLRNKGVLTESE